MMRAWLAGLGLCLATPCYADIGAIGSPVTPSDAGYPIEAAAPAAQPALAPAAAPAAGAPAATVLILTLTFTPVHDDFQRRIVEAVSGSEHKGSAAGGKKMMYDVVAYMPASDDPARTKQAEAAADGALAAVLQEMTANGVEGTRIRASKQIAVTPDQEIRIFVH
jgi:hypothetical protein